MENKRVTFFFPYGNAYVFCFVWIYVYDRFLAGQVKGKSRYRWRADYWPNQVKLTKSSFTYILLPHSSMITAKALCRLGLYILRQKYRSSFSHCWEKKTRAWYDIDTINIELMRLYIVLLSLCLIICSWNLSLYTYSHMLFLIIIFISLFTISRLSIVCMWVCD